MASILRQIVAGPRIPHQETGLDLCYVTPNVIATSGPTDGFPKSTYRNPLAQLLSFLDDRHGQNSWAIWEFRAEGTGYPDAAVRNRVMHYPWPDHHPPPFALIPLIMAGMRDWMKRGVLHVKDHDIVADDERIIVVHCKAGKGRSGTIACSYLISEEDWAVSDALVRFTERRMRPGFGNGVSIPSQVRWVHYVDQWKKSGKIYQNRPVEVCEIHVFGLRSGVSASVNAFTDNGRTITPLHNFSAAERQDIAPADASETDSDESKASWTSTGAVAVPSLISAAFKNTSALFSSSAAAQVQPPPPFLKGAAAAIFRPEQPIRIENSDVNIAFERRKLAPGPMSSLSVQIATAGTWFNAFFESNGSEGGVFEVLWDQMDGTLGTNAKGSRAFDRIKVVWRFADPLSPGVSVQEPEPGAPIQDMEAADWHQSSTVSEEIVDSAAKIPVEANLEPPTTKP